MRLAEVYDWEVRAQARKEKRAELRKTRAERKPNIPLEFKQLLMKLTGVVPWPFVKIKSHWGPWGQLIMYRASDKPRARIVDVVYDSGRPAPIQVTVDHKVSDDVKAKIEAIVKDFGPSIEFLVL